MKDTQKVITVRDAQNGTCMGSGMLSGTALLLAVAATVGAQERLGLTTGPTDMGKPMDKGGEYCGDHAPYLLHTSSFHANSEPIPNAL